ncbi:EamA family transporter [Verrucomicrobiota bacterium sgz303538]
MRAMHTVQTPSVGTSVFPHSTAERSTPPLWLVLAAFAAVYVIWGSTYLGIRLAIDSIPPLMMAGARSLIAGLLLYIVVRLRGAPRPEPVHWRNATIIGAALLLVGNGGVSWAQQTVPSSIAALIIAATPLWINLIDWLRPHGRRPHNLVFSGIALGFVGVALIVWSKDSHGRSVVDPLGAMMLLAASLSWAAGSVFARHARLPATMLLSIAMQMISGGALLLVSSVAMGEMKHLHFGAITTQSAWAFAYLTLLGSLVGYTAYAWLLQVTTAARVSTYAFVNPLIAVLLGRLVLHEPLPKTVLAAGGCILGAVALITLRGGGRK